MQARRQARRPRGWRRGVDAARPRMPAGGRSRVATRTNEEASSFNECATCAKPHATRSLGASQHPPVSTKSHRVILALALSVATARAPSARLRSRPAAGIFRRQKHEAARRSRRSRKKIRRSRGSRRRRERVAKVAAPTRERRQTAKRAPAADEAHLAVAAAGARGRERFQLQGRRRVAGPPESHRRLPEVPRERARKDKKRRQVGAVPHHDRVPRPREPRTEHDVGLRVCARESPRVFRRLSDGDVRLKRGQKDRRVQCRGTERHVQKSSVRVDGGVALFIQGCAT
mmetsp:Transcript_18545/g.57960  ORF Transcript_18545/g.57960 Transcript_18545/m.57960 type:complete len:287 (+) Transcript_18545:1010-1870(+)